MVKRYKQMEQRQNIKKQLDGISLLVADPSQCTPPLTEPGWLETLLSLAFTRTLPQWIASSFLSLWTRPGGLTLIWLLTNRCDNPINLYYKLHTACWLSKYNTSELTTGLGIITDPVEPGLLINALPESPFSTMIFQSPSLQYRKS